MNETHTITGVKHMSIEKINNQVIAHIWQAIAQSDVDLKTIQHEEQEKLVQKIAESMLLIFDEIISEELNASEIHESADDPSNENILWKGRPFLSLVESYVITTERIKIITGFVSRRVENYELIRIQDIDFKQNVGERVFGLGDIQIAGHDASDPSIILRNIPKPEDVYELLRKAWLDARKRYGLQFREYM
jgi:hypothetical protein